MLLLSLGALCEEGIAGEAGQLSPSSQHLTVGPAPAEGKMWLPPGFMDQWEQHSSGAVWVLLLKVFCLFLQPLLLLSPKSCTFLAAKSSGSLSPALSVTEPAQRQNPCRMGCAEWQNQHKSRIPAERMC